MDLNRVMTEQSKRRLTPNTFCLSEGVEEEGGEKTLPLGRTG